MIYALCPVEWKDEFYLWKEQEEVRLMEGTLFLFIQKWCLLHGSTYDGRVQASRYLLHVTQKPPILVSEADLILLFPTRSARHPNCIWINYRAVSSSHMEGKGCRIRFRDDQELIVDVAYRTIRHQMKLCEDYVLHLMSMR